MKAMRIVRKVGHLGRVVLPIEWRRTLGIGEKDPIEIFVVGENIVLQKYSPGCVLCDFPGELTRFKEKPICWYCKQELLATAVDVNT